MTNRMRLKVQYINKLIEKQGYAILQINWHCAMKS